MRQILQQTKKSLCFNQRLFLCLLMLFVSLSAFSAAKGQEGILYQKKGSQFSVQLERQDYKAKIGEPVSIPVHIRPNPAPAGAFYTILADTLSKPEGAKLSSLSGDQNITLKATQPGIYRVKLRINLMEKSSCAGIETKKIGDLEVALHVK
ncbi:MAG: hypothetical protein HQM14_20070 [SAR324 cluster bacterium]|nr:hypothetical protein [SAR324 cluster bacterium]